MMSEKVRRIAILVILTAVLLVSVVRLAYSYVEVGISDEFWTQKLPESYDFSDVPQTVLNDASAHAEELFGQSGEKYQRFVEQLLATYEDAQGKDFIVLFNPGGWGWKAPDEVKGWGSILNGINTELDDMGYESLLLNYKRTGESILARGKELMEVLNGYPSKSKYLASRVDFLTAQYPDLKVVVAGESNGAAMSDSVMTILQDNPQVYSIQTGTPFWYHAMTTTRTLRLNSNGTGPDSFSAGDIPTIIWANIKSTLGFGDRAGTVFLHLKAPGHDYSWQYPEIYNKVTQFLEDNFGIKSN
ncbi:MAG: hypothetical protein PHR56_02545 [Dehalococcoidales bacterium]|nr:hypothetical protein [Dehalococcoidales bacterium]